MAEAAYMLFRRGMKFLLEGRPFQAVIPLERARSLEPRKASIREALARAYFRSGRHTRARDEFAAAVEIDPANDYAHFGLALCLERDGQIARARAHAKLALAMRPHEESYREAVERIVRRSESTRRAETS